MNVKHIVNIERTEKNIMNENEIRLVIQDNADFCSSWAEKCTEKQDQTYIEPGSTHNIFNNKDSFNGFQSINQSPFGDCNSWNFESSSKM